MIRDEDVMRKNTSRYMKPHERVLYWLAIGFGVLLIIGGIVAIVIGVTSYPQWLWILGVSLVIGGIGEIIGVGLLLWTDGEKRKREPLPTQDMFKH